ncbi:MAG: ATP-binding cassette domain-containing protein, partial [Spirochaetes bacterium]|nr:ATP-binding cassette domain-containing protein [Spirochaetota bacterium]
GKTTLIKTILGAYIPYSGVITYQDQSINSSNIHLLRHECSYIGQVPVMGAGKVIDVLLLPYSYKANLHQKPNQLKITQLLEQFQLDPKIIHYDAEELSGGEKQRIAVIRSLLLGKKMIILDEVTSGLDSQSKIAVLDLLKCPDYTIISVSHDIEWIEQCSHFACMVAGEIQSIDQGFSTEVIRKMKGIFND